MRKTKHKETPSLKECLSAFPVEMSLNGLRKLIFKGERKKEWTLPEWHNYLIAVNVWQGTQRARWLVTREEIDAWYERAKRRQPKRPKNTP